MRCRDFSSEQKGCTIGFNKNTMEPHGITGQTCMRSVSQNAIDNANLFY
jgi:hypothetical protein